jgi:DNA-binding GntR family transcriptional regulator
VSREPTRTEAVYDGLRHDILSGAHAPGARLRFSDLAERYGASMGVTREALSRLSEQGFVTSEPQLGFRVVSLSVDDLVDLTESRCHIESLALRLSIEHASLDWESNLLAAHHGVARTSQRVAGSSTLAAAWISAHDRFHNALIANCPNSRLKSLASGLRANAEIYRNWSSGERTIDAVEEHASMCHAALRHDADTACDILVEHLVATARVLLESAPDATPQGLTRLERIRTVCSTSAHMFAERTPATP